MTASPGPRSLTFVTGNQGKLDELRALVAPLGYQVVGDKRGYPEVQADTLEEVGEAGAAHLLAAGLAPPFLLEDSGLFVDGLRGFPGVYSRHAQDTIGCDGILRLLAGVPPGPGRAASFRTDLVFVDERRKVHHFAGRVDGTIALAAAGASGFGFDPIFVPRGHDMTFAQMERAQKSSMSHRGAAVRAFVGFLMQTAKP